MRIAVFSDIHGNAFAFDVILADLKRETFDHIVCLGDAIQGGPQPAEVVAQLRTLGCPIIMGNADSFMLTGNDSGREETSDERERKLNEVREWSMSRLSDDDKAFIAAFKPTVEIPLEPWRNLLCFHGSPDDFDDVILPTTPEEDFQKMLTPYLPHIMTGGHTHMQQIRRIGAHDAFYFNPGSVGFAYSHQQPDDEQFHADAWAEYAILTANAGKLSLEFRRLPYDAQPMIDIYHASGRPYTDEAAAQYSR
jgi:predicted phosphodiesterase